MAFCITNFDDSPTPVYSHATHMIHVENTLIVCIIQNGTATMQAVFPNVWRDPENMYVYITTQHRTGTSWLECGSLCI